MSTKTVEHESLNAAYRQAAITPSDTVDFTDLCYAVYVGTGGDIVGVGQDGVASTFKAVPGGTTLIGPFTRINATSTTATDLVGYF